MALVTMAELLQDARRRQYAVGGFNVFNFETLGAVVEVAEELKTPLVLGIPERLFKFVDADLLGAAMVRAAHKASVPVALHLDHSHTYEGILKAVRWGFTSVMFDGSRLSFEENIRRTKEVAKIAHASGLTVEGELGSLGGEAASGLEEAALFAQKTRIDALAVGCGNHLGDSADAALDVERLGMLRQMVQIPLVMHGGAGLQAEEYRRLIQAGIAKINIATDTSTVAAEQLKKELSRTPHMNYVNLMAIVKKGVKESVRKYMLACECISQAKAI